MAWYSSASFAVLMFAAGQTLDASAWQCSLLEGWQVNSGAAPTKTTTQRREKEFRTPAQRKINSNLLYEIYRIRGEAEKKQVPPEVTAVETDQKGRALVDIRTDVTPSIQQKIRSVQGTIVSTSPQYRSVIAWVPLLKLEELAAIMAVSAIEPSAKPTTRPQ